MNAGERRNEIIKLLSTAESYISASQLAELYGVTRQIIVSDIALLRANGKRIISTQHGYCLERANTHGLEFTVVCKHSPEDVINEFYAIVDEGGRLESVTVEHPLYGQISADLDISSRYDADDFVERSKEAKASQLSDLTGGIHVHTIWVRDSAAKERIINKLNALGIIFKQ